MTLNKEADVIFEYAFENKRNVEIAVNVGLAFPRIKERIIREFVESVIGTLGSGLGRSWTVQDQWSETPLVRRLQILAFKTAWGKNTCVGISCKKNGPGDLYYFVNLWNWRRQKTPLAAQLKGALDKRYANGSSNSRMPWFKPVEPRYNDWTSKEMLISLCKKDEAVEHYTNHLLKICKIAGPFLDKICCK